ncbi:unnamed protein product [Symbiodinium sp. CCMP2592]|nr:unnamed protein product [Symbiodinium sp. CCMP2592]
MAGRLTPLPAAPSTTLAVLDATWMDDLSLMFQAPDSAALIRRLRTGASTLLGTCLEHALLPNLSRGKTEALVHLRAKGARQARKELFVENAGTLPLQCRLWPEARLRLTATYIHLGGVLHHQGSLLREVKAREDKALLFDSLVATTLFYGSGTWPEPTPDCVQKLTGTLRNMACQMLRPAYSAVAQAWHLGATQALAGLPSATTYLHVHRLRYLLSCIVLGVPEIWALAHWEGVWLQSAAASVEWLWEKTDPDRHYQHWEQAWTAWRDEAKRSPGKWKVGAVTQTDLVEDSAASECCAPCRKHFRDYRAWSVHAFSTHGRTDEMSRLLTEGVRNRPEPGVGSKKAHDDGSDLMPVLQASGPRPAPIAFVVEGEVDRPSAEVLDCLAHLDHDGLVTHLSEGALWERIRLAFSCICLQSARLQLTGQCWHDLPCHPSQDAPPAVLARLRSAARWICGTDIVAWLVPDSSVGDVSADTFKLSGLYLNLLARLWQCAVGFAACIRLVLPSPVPTIALPLLRPPGLLVRESCDGVMVGNW